MLVVVRSNSLSRFQLIGSVSISALSHNDLLRNQFREKFLGPRALNTKEFCDIRTLGRNMIRQVSDDLLFLP